MKLPWNFSRPGSAWVMNRQGVYVERGADEPRYQWTPDGRSEGLLVERPATNLFSRFRGNGSWGSTPEHTVDALDSPFTGIKATLINSHTTSNRYQLTIPAGTFASGAEIVVSWAQKRIGYTGVGWTSSGTFFRFTGQENLVYVGTSKGHALSDGWELFSATLTVTDGSADSLLRMYFPTDGNGVIDPYAFCGIQVEAGSVPTSPIPTTGTASTRPADALYADMSLVPGFDPTKGTVVVEWDDIGLVGQPFQVSQTASENPTDGDYWRLSRSTATGRLRLLVNSVSGSSQYTSFSGDLGPRSRAAVRWDGENFGFALDGSMVGALAYAAGPLSGLRFLRIGQETHALYRHVQYIPQAVSDAQLQQLSSLNP